MKIFGNYLARLILIGVLLALIIVFRSYIMTYLVGPIASVLWLFWKAASSVNQSSYWWLIIALFLILFFCFLPPKSEPRTKKESQAFENEEANRQFEEWFLLVVRAAHDKTARVSLRRNLIRLMVSSVSHAERLDPVKVQEDLINKKISLPIAVFNSLFPEKVQRAGFHGQWLWKQKIRKSIVHQNEISNVLDWIENYLEKPHGN